MGAGWGQGVMGAQGPFLVPVVGAALGVDGGVGKKLTLLPKHVPSKFYHRPFRRTTGAHPCGVINSFLYTVHFANKNGLHLCHCVPRCQRWSAIFFAFGMRHNVAAPIEDANVGYKHMCFCLLFDSSRTDATPWRSLDSSVARG